MGFACLTNVVCRMWRVFRISPYTRARTQYALIPESWHIRHTASAGPSLADRAAGGNMRLWSAP
jgi:hypothetical protein